MLLHVVQGMYFNTQDADLGDFLKYHKFKLEPTHSALLSLYPQGAPETLWDTQARSCVRMVSVEGGRNLKKEHVTDPTGPRPRKCLGVHKDPITHPLCL